MIHRLDRPVQRPFIRVMRTLARVALGALFVFAGAAKAYDPGEFAVEIQRYNLLPWILGVVVALYLPWVEILSGLVIVLFKRLRKGALLLLTVMLAIFTVALASAMVRGLSIDCGCFGKALTATGTTVPLIRNVILLGVTAFIWRDNT
jgi:putative oxidoreductase